MKDARKLFLRSILGGAALAGVLAGAGSAWAKGPRTNGPGLRIAADRITGFVPFTVSVYGKVSGTMPGRLELCRSEIAWLTESSRSPLGAGERATSLHPDGQADAAALCASGRVVATPNGYDYQHEMRFDRPGIYHLSLTMVDGSGHRWVSNTIRVSAF